MQFARNSVWAARTSRSCRALQRAGPKVHRAGGAFVHLPREPSASAYSPQERLRPTRAPCSVQEPTYAVAGGAARGSARRLAQFADSSVHTGRFAFRAGQSSDPDQKFTEPVALSSTSPVNLRLPPTALRSGFDLLALRARCKKEATRWAGAVQEGEGRVFRALCGSRLGKALWISSSRPIRRST